jgi:hypothetical protein
MTSVMNAAQGGQNDFEFWDRSQKRATTSKILKVESAPSAFAKSPVSGLQAALVDSPG